VSPRIEVTHAESMDFEQLGKTLELMDGERVLVGLAYRRTWPPADGDANVVGFLGGQESAVLHLVTEDEVDGQRVEPPAGSSVQPGEQEHVLKLGELVLSIATADFVGASYTQGVLGMQVGPIVVTLNTNLEGESHGS
jgi:hypothetical protein